MNKYNYKAITKDGKERRGTAIAESANALISSLKEKGLSVYSYNLSGRQNTKNYKKLNTKDLITFSTQLSQMLTAGLALGQSLQMLYERTEKSKTTLKKTYASLFESVQKGSSLSESMEDMGDTFPNLYVSMVKSGQMSGKLDTTLVQLAEHFDKQKKLQNQIKAAMTYPIILMVISLVVVVMLTTTVLPKMISIIPAGRQIPGPTKVLIAIKDFILKDWYIILVGVPLIAFLIKLISSNETVKEYNGLIVIRLPKFGKLNQMKYTAQFASSLSTLYSVGVNLLDSITMSGDVLTNTYLRKQVIRSTVDIKKGQSISEAFLKIDGFDKMLTTMIFVGEQSGSLGDILKKTSDYFDEEAKASVKALTALLQPVMLVLAAVIIGFVLVGTLMPITEIYKSF